MKVVSIGNKSKPVPRHQQWIDQPVSGPSFSHLRHPDVLLQQKHISLLGPNIMLFLVTAVLHHQVIIISFHKDPGCIPRPFRRRNPAESHLSISPRQGFWRRNLVHCALAAVGVVQVTINSVNMMEWKQ